MRRLLPAPFVLAVLLACGGVGDLIPTPSGYDAQIQAYVGQSITVATRALGAPTRTVDLAAGSRLYVWEEKSEMRTPITGEERYNPQTGTDTIVLNPSQRVPLDCTTELETDAAGIVTHARSEGIACLATARTAPSAAVAAPIVPPAAPPSAAIAPTPVETEPVIADEGAGMGDEPDAPADKRAERRARRLERSNVRRVRRPE